MKNKKTRSKNNIINTALKFARSKHKGQIDDQGKQYVYHPINVGKLISLMTRDREIIAAAILHDTLEDTNSTYEELVDTFGKRVANLVKELTHVKNKEVGAYFPNLKSQWAIVIKMCDRAHNLSRMKTWDEKKRMWYMKRSRFWRTSDVDKINFYQ
jgi:GTP pyrophosphokinase